MKNLCKLNDKFINKHFEEIVSIVAEPKYICERCLRVSCDKSLLCKPVKIKK